MKSDDTFSDEPTGEVPVISPSDSRVTISGAELAGDVVARDPNAVTELPHWTEMPTGQVSIVRLSDVEPSEDAWAQIPAPAWREGEADWVAHEEQFDASFLAPEPKADDPFAFVREEPVKPAEEILAEAPRPEPARAHRTKVTVDNPLAGRAVRRASQPNSVLRATVTGLLMAAVAFGVLTTGPLLTAVLITAVLTISAGEALAQFRAVQAHPATILTLVGIVVLSYSAYVKGLPAEAAITVLMLIIGFAWYALSPRKVDVLDGLGSTMLTFIWIGVLGSYAMLLVAPRSFPNRHGMALLAGAVVITILNDTGALFIGRWIGRRPLVAMSPNKTREGFIGGALITIIGSAIILPRMSPWTTLHALEVALILSFVVPMGDLFESLIKRTLGIKDMGRVLPGMGGLLDRVDGLLFAMPSMYYLAHVLHLG